MPKLKTNRAAHKRFRVTGTGKIKRTNLRKGALVAASDARRVRRMLGM
jgi:large subunit ribosomal protein L35